MSIKVTALSHSESYLLTARVIFNISDVGVYDTNDKIYNKVFCDSFIPFS